MMDHKCSKGFLFCVGLSNQPTDRPRMVETTQRQKKKKKTHTSIRSIAVVVKQTEVGMFRQLSLIDYVNLIFMLLKIFFLEVTINAVPLVIYALYEKEVHCMVNLNIY